MSTAPELNAPEPVEVGYTNWRGEYAVRNIIPRAVWFGSTEWHPEPQWLIKAHDVEKDAERDFALTGFTSPRPDAGVIASPASHGVVKALRGEIAEFMRRLGPQWFLAQGWFPASQQESAALAPALAEGVDK